MKYILESSSFSYLLDQFPKKVMPHIWERFEILCSNESVVSEREVKRELENELNNSDSLDWVHDHLHVFKTLTQKEAEVLGQLMQKNMFSAFERSDRLNIRKLPESIPFVVARAKHNLYTIVYREGSRNEDILKHVCRKNDLKLIEVETFLQNCLKEPL
ncbi:MAG: DUF4411 family protein [Ruminococcus sp.]|nr:DUF4411 family protein [Ruminococcus sp.]